MKSNVLSLTIICLIFGCSLLSAQFPSNFEFLEHSYVKSNLGAYKVHNDAIYFVSHNDCQPHTTINKVTADGTLEVLFKPEFHEPRKSKLFVESDSSFQLVLYDLIDNNDVPTPGIYILNITGSQIRVDNITDHDQFQVSSHSFKNIEKDLNGDWVSMADKIYIYNEKEVISTKLRSISTSKSQLFSNPTEDLYLIKNENKLSKYQNGILTELIRFDEKTSYILSTFHGEYFLSGNKLLQYDYKFQSLIASWDDSDFEGTINSVKSIDGNIEILTSSEDKYYLYQLSSSEMKLIYEEWKNEGEDITQFDKLSQDQYLFTGSYSIEDISKNIFFRNVNIVDNSATVYSKANIEISNLEIILTEQDTYDIIVSSPDTFYGINYYFDLSASYSNESNEDVFLATAFSQEKNAQERLGTSLNIHIDDLPAKSFDDRRVSLSAPSSSELEGIVMALPGANYRFNENKSKLITAKCDSGNKKSKSTKSITAFPNPVEDLLKLKVDNTLGSFTIYNERGSMVYYNKGSDTEIDVSNLNPGNYIISVRSTHGEHLSMGKFIKL